MHQILLHVLHDVSYDNKHPLVTVRTWRFHVTVITAEKNGFPLVDSSRLDAGEVGDSLRVLADLDHQDRPLFLLWGRCFFGYAGDARICMVLVFLKACGL